MRWFNTEHPHQGLDQRTPDEVHFGHNSRATTIPLRAQMTVEYIDGDASLPVLRLRSAA